VSAVQLYINLYIINGLKIDKYYILGMNKIKTENSIFHILLLSKNNLNHKTVIIFFILCNYFRIFYNDSVYIFLGKYYNKELYKY